MFYDGKGNKITYRFDPARNAKIAELVKLVEEWQKTGTGLCTTPHCEERDCINAKALLTFDLKGIKNE